MAVGERAAPRCRRATPRRLRRAPRMGARAVRRPLGGGVVARGVRRPRRLAVGVADLRGGVLPRRAGRSGSRRTASSCSRRRSSSSAPRRSRTTTCPACRRRRTCGARDGRSPTPGSDLAGIQSPGGARRRGGRLAPQRSEDLDDPRRLLHPPVRAVPHRPRRRAPPRPHVLPRAARRRGHHGARVRPPRRRRGLRRGVPRRRVRARRRRAAARLRRRAGASPWPPRRPSAGSRCAPPAGSRPRPRASWLARAVDADDSADDRLRDAVVDAWIDAEAYRSHVPRRHRHRSRASSPGAESSLNKVFWSELDVRLHDVALDLLGPDAELDARAWMKGYEFALVGPDLRRHQRDPAQHHRRARARPPAEVGPHVSFASPRTSSSSATPCAPCSTRSARPRARARRRGPTRPARSRDRMGAARRRWACSACSCPRPTAASA